MTADDSKRDSAQPHSFDVIDPPDDLAHAVDANGDERDNAAALERAQNTLEQLSVHFGVWMEDDLSALLRARDRARNAGLTEETRAALYRAAHDIRGQAATLGFPEAAATASSLCRLLDGIPDPGRIAGSLIDQHVDGVRALVRERGRDGFAAGANDLVDRLAGITREFVGQERDRLGLQPYGEE